MTHDVASNESLVGTWKLVGASSQTKSGERNEHPYGVGPTGFLSYAPDGRVNALISYGGRKLLPAAPRVEEEAEAFKTFLAYGGTYELRGETVSHRVEISSIPNFVGKDLIRKITFQGQRITLVTPPTMLNGKIQTLELVWERLAPASESVHTP